MAEKEAKRAVVVYRTKELKEGAKWSLWFQREIEGVDSEDVMKQFWARSIWGVMTGSIEVQNILWLD